MQACLIQHSVSVVDILSLLLHLALPLVLLVSYTVQHVAGTTGSAGGRTATACGAVNADAQLMRRLTQSGINNVLVLFVRVLLIAVLHALIQQRIQTGEERHVARQQGYDPDYDDDNNFDDGRVPVLVHTFTPRTEFLLSFFDLVPDPGQYNSHAIAFVRRHLLADEIGQR